MKYVRIEIRFYYVSSLESRSELCIWSKFARLLFVSRHSFNFSKAGAIIPYTNTQRSISDLSISRKSSYRFSLSPTVRDSATTKTTHHSPTFFLSLSFICEILVKKKVITKCIFNCLTITLKKVLKIWTFSS